MDIKESKEFAKQIKKIKDKKTREKIFKHIKKLIKNPESGDLLNHAKGLRKIYVPPFRLLYSYKNNVIYLMCFDHRSKIYKKLHARR